MKSKINLVILTPGFAADEYDSTAVPSLQFFLGNLHSQYPDVSIHIISFHYPFSCSDYDWQGLHVHSAGGAYKKMLKPLLWIKILLYLFKLKRDADINIIHSFWLTDTTLIGLIFRQLTGIHFVATAMGQDATKKNKYLWLIRLFKLEPITLSEFQSRTLGQFLKIRQQKVIPFGIDLSWISQRNVERTIDILAVGSLNKTKNYTHFIQIVSSLVKLYPSLNCVIIGEGSERERIEKLISFEGLENHISLYGQLAYEKVIEKMQESKILLHTSKYEGQGLVITEALAAGAYVVSYPVGAAWKRELKKLKTGNSTDELGQHLITILNNIQPDYFPEIFLKIEDTCGEYYNLYRTSISSK